MRRILLDQGLPAGASVIRRERGWDAVHVREVGMQQDADTEILEYAARGSRAVVTLDRDFPAILAFLGASQPSVVLIRRQRLKASDVAELVESVWQAHEAAIDQGCVVRVSERGTRIRLLPLK